MTARHVFLGVLGGGIAAVVLLVGALVERGSPQRVRPEASPMPPGAVTPVDTRAPTPLPRSGTTDLLLLVRDDENDGRWEELLLVEGGRARSFPAPRDALRTVFPVTDGTRVYVLVGKPDARGEGVRLVAVDRTDGSEALISGSTPLVTPRALFASPNGRVIAFYLDSTRGELTELWTVNPVNGEKRVSLERLSKGAAGPFWAPDGGFLVRDGDRVLRGSPQRTGEDLLPVKRSWRDVWPGETMIPSPGGSQVIYVVSVGTTTRGTASEVRVWDLPGGPERVVARIPNAPVRLLGWSSTGELIAIAGTEESVVWEIRKGGQTSSPLGTGASSVVLSGDGRGLAYLQNDSGAVRLVIRDLGTKQEVPPITLPPPASPAPRESTDRQSVFHLLQFVRPEGAAPATGESSVAAPALHQRDALGTALALSQRDALGTALALNQRDLGTGPALNQRDALGTGLASEDVVRYVVEHVREIADAPPEEPVTAERVWFTRTSGTVNVDYRVGTVLWRRLIEIKGVGGRPVTHTILGVFAPADGEWILTRGVNLPDLRPVLLYEFEPELGKWVRKDTPADIQP